MPQSFGPVYVHIVFGTMHAQALLTPELHEELVRYIAPILADCESTFIAEGGMPDHVHLLIDLGRQSAVSDLVWEIKERSSGWLERTTGKKFEWEVGYVVTSVSPSELGKLKDFIKHQEDYHRYVTFRDEFEEMMKSGGVQYDPSFLMHGDDGE